MVLEKIYRVLRLLKFPREAWMTPVRLFSDKSRSLRELSIPNSQGMELESWFSKKDRRVRLLKFPREAGMALMRLFSAKSMELKEINIPNS